MHALQAWQLRLAVVFLVLVAFVAPAGFVSFAPDTLDSKAWAGGRSGGHGHDDDDDDDDRDRKPIKKKDLDHFACYTAAEHLVDKEVKIINQFTTDEYGNLTAQPIRVGELAFLCVPTKKIVPRDHDKKPQGRR